jgi:hypothetical protein
MDLFPEGEHEFLAKTIDLQTSFQSHDKDGGFDMILHVRGVTIPAHLVRQYARP